MDQDAPVPLYRVIGLRGDGSSTILTHAVSYEDAHRIVKGFVGRSVFDAFEIVREEHGEHGAT